MVSMRWHPSALVSAGFCHVSLLQHGLTGSMCFGTCVGSMNSNCGGIARELKGPSSVPCPHQTLPPSPLLPPLNLPPPPPRCDEVASTITLLGGLSLLHASRDALHLKLVTAYPTSAVRSSAGAGSADSSSRSYVAGSSCDPGPCATADHELSVHMQPGSDTGECQAVAGLLALRENLSAACECIMRKEGAWRAHTLRLVLPALLCTLLCNGSPSSCQVSVRLQCAPHS